MCCPGRRGSQRDHPVASLQRDAPQRRRRGEDERRERVVVRRLRRDVPAGDVPSRATSHERDVGEGVDADDVAGNAPPIREGDAHDAATLDDVRVGHDQTVLGIDHQATPLAVAAALVTALPDARTSDGRRRARRRRPLARNAPKLRARGPAPRRRRVGKRDVLRVGVDVVRTALGRPRRGFAHKRVGSGGGGRGRTRQPPAGGGRVRFRFVFSAAARAAREALEVVEPRRAGACASRPTRRRRASPPRPGGGRGGVHSCIAWPSSRTTRAPPAAAACRGRLPGVDGSVSGKTRGRKPSAHAERMRAWGRGGDDPRGVRRRECGRASHFFGSREKKCLYGCGEHAGSVASPRSARLGEEAPETLATRAPRCGPSRDGDASNPCVPLTQGVITVEPERENIWFCSLGIPKLVFVGERPFAGKLEGAELLPEGMSRSSRRPRSTRARLAGLALALGLAMLASTMPRASGVEPARAARRARLARLEKKCAGTAE